MRQNHATHCPSPEKSRLSALINWICARSIDTVLVLDLVSETVLTGDAKTTSLLSLSDSQAAAMSNLFTPEAITTIRTIAASDLHSPFLRSQAAGPDLWRFESLIPGELGVLFQSVQEYRPSGSAESQATADELTGLAPRGSLASILNQSLASFRNSGVAFALLFLDFDHFKLINDEQGHLAGDEVLRRAAAEILHTIRPGDRAVRYGGDEFVMVIGGLHSTEEALAVARRVRDAASKPVAWRETVLQVTASVGVGFVRSNDATAETVLERADHAMYRAKNLGRSGRIELD